MKKKWVWGYVILEIAGCSEPSSSGQSAAEVVGCPEVAPQLAGDRVTKISIQYQEFFDSGKVSRNESVGYQFSSFTNKEKAQAFARLISSEISGATVAEPTVIKSP